VVVLSVEVPQSGNGGCASLGLPIEPAPGGQLESATVWASLCLRTGTQGEVIEPGWPSPTCTTQTRTFPPAQNFRGLSVALQCPLSCGAQVHAGPFATVMVAPVVKGVTGTPLAGGVQRRDQKVSAKASDFGGGLSKLAVLVNGVVAATTPEPCAATTTHNSAASGIVAAAIVPCPTSAEGEWTLDTGAYTFRQGANTVSVCASDLATLGDPDTTCSTPQSVDARRDVVTQIAAITLAPNQHRRGRR
jgi:hypothetical protein